MLMVKKKSVKNKYLKHFYFIYENISNTITIYQGILFMFLGIGEGEHCSFFISTTTNRGGNPYLLSLGEGWKGLILLCSLSTFSHSSQVGRSSSSGEAQHQTLFG